MDRTNLTDPAVCTEFEPGESLLRVDGELSIANADALHRLFSSSLARGVDVVADFGAVDACDTAALQLMCSLRKTALQHGRRFRISAVSSAVMATASALGLPMEEFTGGNERGV